MNINRLLSRREKDGGPHRRDKSREKSSDRKVKCLEYTLFPVSSLISAKPTLSPCLSSISAAFSKPHEKGSALLQTSYYTIHTTSTDSRPGFVLQTIPHSSEHPREGIIGLFKPDPQKKHDNEQETRVRILCPRTR
jgi:hypothetical protein